MPLASARPSQPNPGAQGKERRRVNQVVDSRPRLRWPRGRQRLAFRPLRRSGARGDVPGTPLPSGQASSPQASGIALQGGDIPMGLIGQGPRSRPSSLFPHQRVGPSAGTPHGGWRATGSADLPSQYAPHHVRFLGSFRSIHLPLRSSRCCQGFDARPARATPRLQPHVCKIKRIPRPPTVPCPLPGARST
jgi:hypothetical protein